MANDEGGDDEVGYGKPPKHSQFKKGQSGNRKGRPKGTLNINTEFEKELAQKVMINQNGKRESITKLQAVIKQLVNKTVQGDARTMKLFLELARAGQEQAAELQAKNARPTEDLTDAELVEIITNGGRCKCFK